jgi:lysophospholipase L1-like esterase
LRCFLQPSGLAERRSIRSRVFRGESRFAVCAITEYSAVYFCSAVRLRALSTFSFNGGSMKLFLKKVLIFLIPVAAFLCLFEALLRSIPNEYSYKKERMITDAQNIEVLILGNSHSLFGIDPEFISPCAFNSANVSQSLDVDYKLLIKYGERMENLRCVIIPISYSSLYSRIQEGIETWRAKNYIIYYGFFFGLKSFSPRNHFELCNGTFVSNIKRLLSYYKENKSTLSVTETGFQPRNITADETELQKSGETAAERHKNTKNRAIDYSEEILINIISWCAARNIQVFFFTVPAYKTYINNLNAAQLYGTVAYMEDLARRYDNVTYENFLFEYKDKRGYFRDSDHLNAAGARAFSAQIHDILQERGLVD